MKSDVQALKWSSVWKKKSLKHFQVLIKKQARHVAEWNSNGL